MERVQADGKRGSIFCYAPGTSLTKIRAATGMIGIGQTPKTFPEETGNAGLPAGDPPLVDQRPGWMESGMRVWSDAIPLIGSSQNLDSMGHGRVVAEASPIEGP